MNTKKDDKKIYVVSWFFPPVNSAEGIVTYKLLKNSKYSYDVYTQASDDKYAFKKDDKLISKNINTIFSDKLNKKEWVKSSVDYYLNNKDKYSCIMTRCMPIESFEVGLKIKKKDKNVFWIASFSDPLAYSPYTKIMEEQNPYKKMKFSPSKLVKNGIWNLRRLHYRTCTDPEIKNKKIQKAVLNNANIIIFNNEYQKKYILSKYKGKNYEKKSIIIPHSYDKDFYEKKEKFYKDKKVMSFLGHLDNFRNASDFLEALNKLNQNEKTLKDKIEFRFYGNMGDKDKEYIKNNKLENIIKLCKPVTYLESLKIMTQSDYLLLIDANLIDYIKENIFFASKIVDYLGSNTKVFAITMENGISKNILVESGAIVSSFDVEEIYEKLYKIIYKPDKVNIRAEFINKFNNKEVVKILDNMIEKNVMTKEN